MNLIAKMKQALWEKLGGIQRYNIPLMFIYSEIRFDWNFLLNWKLKLVKRDLNARDQVF